MLGTRRRKASVPTPKVPLGLIAVALSLAIVAAPVGMARAFELWSDDSGERSVDLNLSAKSTGVLSYASSDTVYFPERWSAASFWRVRAMIDARASERLSAQVVYEHSSRSISEGAGAAGGSGLLPGGDAAPYRIWQAKTPLVEIGSTFFYRHEVDRAMVTAALGRADLTIGRQAVGWGRGLVFSAVDIFAPFTPLEIDREWRRGIDAVRLRAPVTDLVSVDGVAALGESTDESAFVGRIQGYVGDVDGEFFAGTRCEDVFLGATISLPVLDAEVHGEAAAFMLPRPLTTGGSFGNEELVVKTVIGGSRTFDIASGLMVVAEYHYSGFGVKRIRHAYVHFADTELTERYARGDSQIIGRHATALQLSYGFAGLTPFSLTWVASPVDGSGVLIPSVVWVFSDNVTLTASGYIGYGEEPDGQWILSEYGGTPNSGVVQVSFYY